MLNLIIDDRSESFFPESETCFGQVFEKLSERMSGEGKVITEVRMNGQALTGGRQGDYYRFPLDQIQSIDIVTADPQTLACEALDSTEEHLQMLRRSALRASELFRLGDQLEANEGYSKMIEGIRWLLKAIDALTGMLKIDQSAVEHEGKNLQDFLEKQFIPIFDNMYEAQKNEDWIALADILEYELVQALEGWEDMIAELRSTIVEAQ